MTSPTYLAPHTTVASSTHVGAVVGVAPRSDNVIEHFVFTGNCSPPGSLGSPVPGAQVQNTALTMSDARKYVAAIVGAIAAVASALSGTASLTAGSAAVTFTGSQTLPAGAILFFSSQPGVPYTLASAVSGTSGTLTQAYSGSTASGLGVTTSG